MTLVDVYSAPEAARVLYDLLAEREPVASISHKVMPKWEDHVRFVASKPYQAWYLIEDGDGRLAPPQFVGAIYLTKPAGPSRAGDEIGVAVFKAQRRKGYAKAAIKALMEKHGKRRYLANINPQNQTSIAMFSALGFRHVQNTYAFG